MIRLIAVVAGALALAAPAAACPERSDELIFHSCWGEASAAVLLLPEDAREALPEGAEERLTFTGAYTGREPREEGRPAPVGFFMREGEVINRNMARMDGLLVIDPATGALSLHDRSETPLGGTVYNLRNIEDRHHFRDAAAARGLSVLQSHLLIIDGEPDVTDLAEAPRFRRRMLFTDADGYGVFQTSGAVTLHDAAERLDEAHAPDMALNLDMGSYDLCLIEREGVERRCGVLGTEQMDKLSNLIELTLR